MCSPATSRRAPTCSEIGPGGGRWTESLLARGGASTSSSEPAAAGAAAASASATATGGSRMSSPRAATSRAWPLARSTPMWSFDVLVHVAPCDLAGYLSEIARVLAPGGDRGAAPLRRAKSGAAALAGGLEGADVARPARGARAGARAERRAAVLLVGAGRVLRPRARSRTRSACCGGERMTALRSELEPAGGRRARARRAARARRTTTTPAAGAGWTAGPTRSCCRATPRRSRRCCGWCYEHDVPLVARGGGTGPVGGAVPTEGSVVVLARAAARACASSSRGCGGCASRRA